MSDQTKISWCDATVNLWWGCTPWGRGCSACYASAWANRWGFDVFGKGKPRRIISDKTVAATLRKLRKRAHTLDHRPRVFAQSMADNLDAEVPEEQRDRLWKLILANKWCDWLLLTKRADRFNTVPKLIAEQSHCWWLVSCCDQDSVDERVPLLLGFDTVGKRGISLEPMIGPVDFDSSLGGTQWMGGQRGCRGMTEGVHYHDDRCAAGLDLVIAGGESGPGARPCDISWIRSIVRQCKAAGVACFVKQLGKRVTVGGYDLDHPNLNDEHQGNITLRAMRHSKGGDPSEWPPYLRVRELP